MGKRRRDVEVITREFDAISSFFDRLSIAANSLDPFYREYFTSQSNGTALDVGCGTGRGVVELCARFQTVHGIDVSQRMLNRASLRARSEGVLAHFSRMNATELAFDDEQFDFIVASTVLHHLHDLGPAIFEMRRVLRDGGRLVVVDILRRRLTGHAPLLSAYALAAFESFVSTVRHGFGRGRSVWRDMTRSEWLCHQAGESFLTESELHSICEDHLPGAAVTYVTAERGLTQYIVVRWQKS
jgi:ubiquinone/menaquinone biosynthesis C-methylase UbiE